MSELLCTFERAKKALARREVSLPELVEFFLWQAKEHAYLNAWIELWAEEALTRAVQIQAKLNRGEEGPLAGLIAGIKDNICVKGHECTAGSRILKGFVSTYSATVVERLLAADAILIGRHNCDEFGMGSANEYSAYGPVSNPYDLDRVPGGSSGGGAAAVAACTCMVAIGSDTGGSVRQPAAFCGIIGYKPTYGYLSRYGLIAFASSLDQIGFMARSVYDIAAVMDVCAGIDERDFTSISPEGIGFVKALEQHSTETYRVAVAANLLEMEGVEPSVAKAVMRTARFLQDMGHIIEEVAMPYVDYLVPIYQVIATAEASSNLARYDGVRYGYRTPRPSSVEELYVKTRGEGFGAEVKRRILLGTFVLSAGFYEEYYTIAQKARTLLIGWANSLFEKYDFLLLPTTPTPAFRKGEKDPISMYLADQFTVLANLIGAPAISLPAWFARVEEKQLPVGVQLVAPPKHDHHLLSLSYRLQHLLLTE